MKIGEIEKDAKAGVRDAIHVPVVAARPKYIVNPGASVVFTDDTLQVFEEADGGVRHGIVDPFLNKPVMSKETCMVFIDPGMQIHVRHHYDLDVGKAIEFVDPNEDEDDGCRGCY